MGRKTPKPLTQAQMHDATELGSEWRMIWVGQDPFAEREHFCAPMDRGAPYRSEWVRVPYTATATPGVQAAKCPRCRVAWVRAV